MKCDRTGCDKPFTARVKHYSYDAETYACSTHASWWIFGAYGRRIGEFSMATKRAL